MRLAETTTPPPTRAFGADVGGAHFTDHFCACRVCQATHPDCSRTRNLDLAGRHEVLTDAPGTHSPVAFVAGLLLCMVTACTSSGPRDSTIDPHFSPSARATNGPRSVSEQ
jgi:hypothetical protein